MGLLDDIPGREGLPVAAGQPYFISDGCWCVTHYFSYQKAKEELGYVPMVSPRDGLATTITYWWEKKKRELDVPPLYVWVLVVGGMLALFFAAFVPPYGPLKWLQAIALFIFRSICMVRLVFYIAVALHVGESIYAFYLARTVDPGNAKLWFWQTLFLGGFSLYYLLKIVNAKSSGQAL